MNVSIFAKCGDMKGDWMDCKPRILSRSDSELRLAWPEELVDEKYSQGRMEIALSKFIDPANVLAGVQRREIKAVISKEGPKK